MNVLRRRYDIREVKFADGDEQTMAFSGYGAVFGNEDYYGDVIEKGAFADSIAAAKSGGEWPAMLAQHDSWDGFPIGVWTEMKEDDHGLYLEGCFADTEKGREAYALLSMQPRPAITGLSIGYRPVEWSMRQSDDDPHRTLKKVDLVEVSLVTMPANDLARVTGVKSIDEISSLSDVETYLREAGGFSRREAKSLIAKIKGNDHPRDAGDEEAEIAALITRNIQILKGE